MGDLRTYRINVQARHTTKQSSWVTTAHQLQIDSLTGCVSARVFFVRGILSETDIEQLAQELLADPVSEVFTVGEPDTADADHTIDVTLQAGVTDPVAQNLIRAARNLNIDLENAASGQFFQLYGELSDADLETLATTVLSNPVIQRHSINSLLDAPFVAPHESDGLVETIPIRNAGDNQLIDISKERRLSLNLIEMQAVQQWYQDEDRDPTDIELEMVAQTWSEHCVHKTFKAEIRFEDADGDVHIVDGLINEYLRAATEKVDKDWVVSAFVDNAGIIRFDETFDLAFKAETHNHPSALEPFGGANTGVGGVVRDVLGVSAKPIANTDILCFGHQNMPMEDVPDGVLHPRRIQAGVVHGVEDYGNKMGIPTVSGAILYDEGYTANPLVFCGCVGILPHGSHVTEPQAGDYVVVLGGRTGRDGLRGATFSSMEMDTSTSDIASISVQIGHPINEKQVQEVILRARDEGLYNAITDCGAGGLSSAVGEMGEVLGADVQLQTIPLKYPGLRPWEIWLSEAQERMVMAVAPEKWERLLEIANGQDVEITNIGTFGNDGRITLRYGDEIVGDIGTDLLHECLPRRTMHAKWTKPEIATTDSGGTTDLKESLLKLLAHPNIRSKEDVVRRYDHEVQGGTVVKPFVGVEQHVGGDATVIVPIETAPRVPLTLNPSPTGGEDNVVKGFALSVGVCPQYTALDPYAMGWAAIDEAFRNLVAVGADPDQVSLLDNFSWGNPNLPDRLGSLVLATKACHDAAVAYNAPFISGKDSLNNEYTDADGEKHAIPGTLVISALGVVPDVTKTVTMDLKQAGNTLYVIGETRAEMGGSHFNMVHGIEGGTVPQPNENAIETMRALHKAIQAGLVVSCHDVSEGGIAVALAEMCIAGGLGADVAYDNLQLTKTYQRLSFESVFFSESATRFIVEVADTYSWHEFCSKNSLVQERIGQVTSSNEGYESYWEEYGDETFKSTLLALGDDSTQSGSVEAWSLQELEQAYRGHITPADDETPERYMTPEPVESPVRVAQTHDTPRVLILHANGTNRDHDAALACELAGGDPEIVHINQLMSGERNLLDYHMLVVPGGFSYGDDLGAGQLWAQDLRYKLRDDLERFALNGRPLLGICNGFQVLLKAGLLPYTDFASGDDREVTLSYNEKGHFECRWVYLRPNPRSVSLFTEGIDDLLYVPVAHGEGRVVTRSEKSTRRLWNNGLVALTYTDSDGEPVGYPQNPNGSVSGIAALCNYEGNVMGLMPHPEDHIYPWQHPRVHRGERGGSGLVLFKNGIRHA